MATSEGTNIPDVSSTLPEVENIELVDDSGYSSGDISSRLHPERLDFDHINTLETFTEDLNQALSGSFPRSRYPYSSVTCLLLSWEDDDLNVQIEINQLQEVFERQFRFTTKEFKIPSKPNPTRALQDELYAFQNAHQDENELLIVYYAGHGEADSRRGRSIWSANRHKDSPSLNWSSLQHLLENAIPHVLIILDCCFAANAARDTTEGTTKELLAACGRENPTLGVGERSFTSALIEELKAFQSNPFTVAMLHSRLICMRWRLKYTPILAMLSEKSTPSIHLAPIPVEGAHPPAGIAPRASVDTRVLLAVSMAQDTVFGVEEWIRWLNTPQAPAGIININVRLESAYMSHSTLILLSVPILAWSRMVDRDAYNFIGFVRSGNLLRKSEVQDLDVIKEKQSKSRLGSQKLDMDEFFDSKINPRAPLASSPRDSGFEGESDDREYLRLTSLHDIALEVKHTIERWEPVRGLDYMYAAFEDMYRGEKMHSLLGLLERCTKEQQDFIRELLSMEFVANDGIWDNFYRMLDDR